MSIKYRVGLLDVTNAGKPVTVIVKPAIPDAAQRAPEVLDRLAARGPRHRVGLVPSAASRQWEFCDTPGSWCGESIDISGRDAMQDIVDHIAEQDVTVPISASQSGEYLCVPCNHGIGDSHLIFEICAALTQHEPGLGFVEPLAAPTTAHPLAPAVFDTARATPRQFVRSAVEMLEPTRAFVRKKLAARGDGPRIAASTPAGDQDQARDAEERYSAVWCTSERGFTDDVRRYRDAEHPNSSVTAILMLQIYQSLEKCGAVLDDDVEVVVDMRRFLGRNRSTLANFFTVARVDVRSQPSVEDFGASLRQAAGSVRTLLMLAGHLAVNRVRMLLARLTGRSGRPFHQPVSSARTILTFSESRAPGFDKIAWTRPDDAEVAIVSPPAGPSNMSIFVSRTPNGSIQLTATFYASQVAKSVVARGLERALSSEALLQQPETISLPAS